MSRSKPFGHTLTHAPSGALGQPSNCSWSSTTWPSTRLPWSPPAAPPPTSGRAVTVGGTVGGTTVGNDGAPSDANSRSSVGITSVVVLAPNPASNWATAVSIVVWSVRFAGATRLTATRVVARFWSAARRVASSPSALPSGASAALADEEALDVDDADADVVPGEVLRRGVHRTLRGTASARSG